MALLVIGTVAFDSIRTPHGRAENILGGSATYFSLAASWFVPVQIVAVVGEDFGEEQLRLFQDRGVDTAGLEQVPGKTFHWSGEYVGDMNEANARNAPQRFREILAHDTRLVSRQRVRVPGQYRSGVAAPRPPAAS